MEISVHDNLLLSYVVDAQNREIHLHTQYPYGATPEQTDIVFAGVVAYDFEADNLMSILFDVEETTLEAIYEQHQARFERLRNYGWPTVNCGEKDEMLRAMHAQNIKGFEITSSLGLEGWVWAKSLEKRVK